MILKKIFNFFKYKYQYFFLGNLSKQILYEKKDGLVQKIYKGKYAYQNYLKHQKFKFFFYKKDLLKAFDAQVEEFLNNFQTISAKYQHKKYVLCLAARTGAEVLAFRKLGFFCIGIDLNFPKDSPYVFYGDFHNLDFPDDTFDVVYSNSLDHSFNINKLVEEAKRVLKKDGLMCFHLQKGIEENKKNNLGNYEALGWNHTNYIIQKILNNDLIVESKKDLNENYVEVLLKKK